MLQIRKQPFLPSTLASSIKNWDIKRTAKSLFILLHKINLMNILLRKQHKSRSIKFSQLKENRSKDKNC